MNPSQLRPWWLRKRVLLPLFFVTGVLVAGVLAFAMSDKSFIVIYNETGHVLPPLLVRACTQERTYASLDERESAQFILSPHGGETPVRLELATDPPWQWEGEAIKPCGGHRVIIRLWPDGQVEAYSEISWWQETFL
jgi:hypothetical protein